MKPVGFFLSLTVLGFMPLGALDAIQDPELEPAHFHVRSHSAFGLEKGDLVMVDSDPIGEVIDFKLDSDQQLIITFKVWRQFRHVLKDNMLVHVREKKTSSKLVFVSKKGKKPGQLVPPGTMYYMASKRHIWNRKLLGNPSRQLAKGVSNGYRQLRGNDEKDEVAQSEEPRRRE